MIAWMTTTENRALEMAERKGFLSCRRDQRTLMDQHAARCRELHAPVLRVERHAQGLSQVVLHWPQQQASLAAERQDQLRELLGTPTGSQGLLPLVFRGGAYSQMMQPDDAEILAVRIAAWLSEP